MLESISGLYKYLIRLCLLNLGWKYYFQCHQFWNLPTNKNKMPAIKTIAPKIQAGPVMKITPKIINIDPITILPLPTLAFEIYTSFLLNLFDGMPHFGHELDLSLT